MLTVTFSVYVINTSISQDMRFQNFPFQNLCPLHLLPPPYALLFHYSSCVAYFNIYLYIFTYQPHNHCSESSLHHFTTVPELVHLPAFLVPTHTISTNILTEELALKSICDQTLKPSAKNSQESLPQL